MTSREIKILIFMVISMTPIHQMINNLFKTGGSG